MTRRYDRLARVYDLFERPMDLMIGRRRRRLLANASGRTREVGVGTGRNLGLYPQHADLVGIDLSAKMLERAQRNAAGRSLDVSARLRGSQGLTGACCCWNTSGPVTRCWVGWPIG